MGGVATHHRRFTTIETAEGTHKIVTRRNDITDIYIGEQLLATVPYSLEYLNWDNQQCLYVSHEDGGVGMYVVALVTNVVHYNNSGMYNAVRVTRVQLERCPTPVIASDNSVILQYMESMARQHLPVKIDALTYYALPIEDWQSSTNSWSPIATICGDHWDVMHGADGTALVIQSMVAEETGTYGQVKHYEVMAGGVMINIHPSPQYKKFGQVQRIIVVKNFEDGAVMAHA